MNPYKEQAIYCARTNAAIRNEPSTWEYKDDDRTYAVTATPDGKYKTKRV